MSPDSPETRTDGGGAGFLTKAAQLVGLLGGIAVAIYVSGGLVVYLRLRSYGYSNPAVVTALPRELLIADGLLAVVLPFLAVAVVYVCIRLFLPGVNRVPKARSLTTLRRFSLAWAAMIAVLAVYGAKLIRHVSTSWPGVLFAAAVILVGASATMMSALLVRNWAAKRYASSLAWNGIPAVGLAAAAWAFAIIPVGIIGEALVKLDVAKLCTEKDEILGRFLGEGSSNVYLGELKKEEGGIGRIVSIPTSEVKRVFQSHTVTGAEGADCVQNPPKNRQGTTGDTGAKGSGATGPTGPTGARGAIGVQGRPGAHGSPGARGPAGPGGPPGPGGRAGARGSPGPLGPRGARGPRGVRGPPGPRGRRGRED